MSTESGIPVTRILVSGCTANFKPHFYLINVNWYKAFFYICICSTYFFPFKIKPFLIILLLTPPLPPFTAECGNQELVLIIVT